MSLSVATCQFPIDSTIKRNFSHISQQIETAADHGADVVHFPEAALSGYAGVDFSSYETFDWTQLHECTQEILNLARDHRIWIVLGSTHPLSEGHKPHNSLYIIDDQGEIMDRYDKRFCAGDPSADPAPYNDLAYYTSGNHFTVFEINDIKCGALICHDYRYPELYRAYKRKGVQLMFHSYHAGNLSPEQFDEMRDEVGDEHQELNPGSTIPGITMPATMIARAGNNHMWISCPNSSAPKSCWGGFFVRPDGVMTGQLQRNEPGVLISTVDTDVPVYDSTAELRTRALNGVLHSGALVDDERSENRTRL